MTQKVRQMNSEGTVMAKKKRKTLASTADKYKCYLASVQSPEHEIEFFDQAFKDEFGRKPKTLREDFCGTFAVCCEWVKKTITKN